MRNRVGYKKRNAGETKPADKVKDKWETKWETKEKTK